MVVALVLSLALSAGPTYPLRQPAADPEGPAGPLLEPGPAPGLGELKWGSPRAVARRVFAAAGGTESGTFEDTELVAKATGPEGIPVTTRLGYDRDRLARGELELFGPPTGRDFIREYFRVQRWLVARFGKPTQGPTETWPHAVEPGAKARYLYVVLEDMRIESEWDLPEAVIRHVVGKPGPEATFAVHKVVLTAKPGALPPPGEDVEGAAAAKAAEAERQARAAEEARRAKVDGYAGAEWGADPAAVRALFGGQAEEEDDVLAGNTRVGDYDAERRFVFAGGQLAQVVLSFPEVDFSGPTLERFNALREALQARYGKPSGVTGPVYQPQRQAAAVLGGGMRATWQTPRTAIELVCVGSDGSVTTELAYTSRQRQAALQKRRKQARDAKLKELGKGL